MVQYNTASTNKAQTWTATQTYTAGILDNQSGSAQATARESLDLPSSSTSEDRIRLASFFETDSTGIAEVIRMHFGVASGSGAAGGDSAKAALAWYDDTISTTIAQVWVQAHNYLHQYDPQTFTPANVNTGTGVVTYTSAGIAPINAWQVQFTTTGTLPSGLSLATNYYVKILSASTFSIYNDAALTSQVTLSTQGTGTHTMTPQLAYSNNHHQHYSVEVTGTDQQTKSSRFSIPYGYDTTEIGFFGSNVNVNAGTLRINGAAGSARTFEIGNTLSDNLAPDGTQNRWTISANSTAESGSNAGSDLAIGAWSDSGVALSTPIFVQRSTGNVAIQGSTSPTHQLEIGSGGTSTLAIIRAATSNFATMSFSTGVTDEWGIQMRNDATNNLHVRDTANGKFAMQFIQNATQSSLSLLGAASLGGGVGVIFIAQDSTDPTTNPTAGIILYVDSTGNLKARTSAGNVRTIAAV